MTSHNRRETTVACLETVMRNQRPEKFRIDIFLVDDGSTDDTADVVIATFPGATVTRGDGTLFWNRGMHLAFAGALGSDYDFYLWLNDDTLLTENAIENLVSTHEATFTSTGKPGIIVGSLSDPLTGTLTYGGLIRASRWRALKFRPLPPTLEPRLCDTMNGNCVLIPAQVAKAVKNLDWAFEHSMGDYDYALRARGLGIPVWIAPGFVGTCKRNSPTAFENRDLSLATRLRSMTSRKNLPVKSWIVYTHRHGGFFWPLYFVWPYIKLVISATLFKIYRK